MENYKQNYSQIWNCFLLSFMSMEDLTCIINLMMPFEEADKDLVKSNSILRILYHDLAYWLVAYSAPDYEHLYASPCWDDKSMLWWMWHVYRLAFCCMVHLYRVDAYAQLNCICSYCWSVCKVRC